MNERPDLNAPCPKCGRPIGDHTFREYSEQCLAGYDYTLPYEEIPDGPLHFPGVDGDLVGEATVMAGFVDTAMGRMPIVRFIFTGPGLEPMSRRSLRPITLLMDANGLRTFRQLVSTTVDKSILAARRGR